MISTIHWWCILSHMHFLYTCSSYVEQNNKPLVQENLVTPGYSFYSILTVSITCVFILTASLLAPNFKNVNENIEAHL